MSLRPEQIFSFTFIAFLRWRAGSLKPDRERVPTILVRMLWNMEQASLKGIILCRCKMPLQYVALIHIRYIFLLLSESINSSSILNAIENA